MTTLADIKVNDQFLFVCLATEIDDTGMSLSLYGPSNILAAVAKINADGSMTGQLAAIPSDIPVTLVTGFVPFTIGDVLENEVSGETMVCRWSEITDDGNSVWSSSVGNSKVIYSPTGWTVIGHVVI